MCYALRLVCAMPCTLKIKIISARDLPVMDRQSKLTDAFVTIRLGHSHSYRTPIAYKTLHPTWNAAFRIDVVDDLSLQDEPLLLTVWDKDYVTDDSIGTVMVDLNPLLTPDATQRLYGWMPLYDTIHGIRGSIKASVKVEAFTDSIAKDTSASVTVYGVSHVSGYTITHIHGFVEELITSSDPEYHWVDSFRASRVSNEQRQLLFNQLGAKVRRNVGRKAIEFGANCVVAYRLSMDLEGEFGVVVRAMGTAVTIIRTDEYDDEQNVHSAQRTNTNESVGGTSNATGGSNGIVGTANAANAASASHTSHSYRRDVHLLTMNSFPQNMHFTLGGLVSARAVKLLDSRGVSLTADHDVWWTEVRAEVKAHAKRLNCSQVIGYREETTIHDDCVILSAYGTAARGGWYRGSQRRNSRSTVLPVTVPPVSAFKLHRRPQSACAILHIPYARTSMPFRMQTTLCSECGKRVVPEFILSTMEIATDTTGIGLPVPIIGRGQMIEARICRSKKRLSGESNAIAVSELLPFIEYDLHRALVYKLRVAGCNGAFKIHSQLTLGDNMIIGTITATAVYIPLLPAPPPLTIKRYRPILSDSDQRFVEAQNALMSVSKRNRNEWNKIHRKWRRVMRSQRRYRRRDERTVSAHTPPRSIRTSKRRTSNDEHTDGASEAKEETKTVAASSSSSSSSSSSDDDSDKDNANASNEVVLSVDDIADDDLMMSLIEPQLPANVALVNTESPPLGSASAMLRQRSQLSTASMNVYGEPIQMLTAIKRIEWADDDAATETVDTLQRGNRLLAALYHDVYAAVAYQLNAYRPCVLTGTVTQVSVVGLNSVQVICSGMILSANTTHQQPQPQPQPHNESSDESATDSDSDSGDDSKVVRVTDSPLIRRSRERTAPTLKRAVTNGQERMPMTLTAPPSTPSSTSALPLLIPQLTSYEDERLQQRLTAHFAHCGISARVAHSRSGQHNGHATPLIAPTPHEASVGQRINSSPTQTTYVPPPHTSAAAASLIGLFRSASTSHTQNENGADEANDVRIAATMETLRSLAAINTDAPTAQRPPSLTPTLSLPPPHWLQPQSSLTPTVTAAIGLGSAAATGGGVATMSAHVIMTPLTLIPRYDIVAYRGRLRFTLIKEVWSVQSGGGLGVFIHTFLSELRAVMRSHCTSRGGNAVVGYVLDEIRVIEQNKTQAYSIVSVSGDCVRVEQSKQ